MSVNAINVPVTKLKPKNQKLTDAFQNIDLAITDDGSFAFMKNGVAYSKPLTLTLDGIIEQIKKYGYQKPYDYSTRGRYYSRELENHAIPYMVFPYYFFVWKTMRIPSLEEYTKLYFKMFCKPTDEEGMCTFKEQFDSNPIVFTVEALVGRLARSYNSFTRELHLLLYIKKRFPQLKVEYDLKADLSGIDLNIWNGQEFFGFATYVNTRRSCANKVKKNIARHDYSNIQMIDIKAELSGTGSTFSLNNVNLYTPEYIDRVIETKICQKAA